jgi:hypothetical protein
MTDAGAFDRYPSLRYGQGRYNKLSNGEDNDGNMEGLSLNVDRSKVSPVSPLSPQYPPSTAQNTPGLSSGFPTPALLHAESYNGSEIELLKPGETQINCPTNGDIISWSWVTIFMCFLALYSFCFSGVFLGIALARPRWGRRIGGDGNLSYNTATLLSALFSKTVELAFVAVLVTTIGQILSRRAIARRSGHHGITIAEITMRSWILQPGLIFTHGDAIKYAGPTILGVVVLIATLAATFYTTAAEALAAPKLKFGGWDSHKLVGVVDTAFANVTFLTNSCNIPIPAVDDVEAGRSCLQVSYAGQSYHNFQSFMSNWTAALVKGPGNSTMSGRPRPSAMLYDNTTVIGQWITPSGENITGQSTNRLIQNVSMAMPHANIFNAARNAANGIAQPGELAGQGEYFIAGALPAPTLNVLCAGLSSEEIKPFIYDPGVDIPPPESTGPTVLDDIFNFGNYTPGGSKQPAPLFPHLPIIYNTINNNSNIWGPPAVFLLSTPPPEANQDHILCSIKITQYPHCTTRYHAAESGGELSAHCDDDVENTLSYSSKNTDITQGHYESNWKDIGSEWLRSIALGQGINNDNASIARIITQMTPRFEPGKTVLDPGRPSIAEALAVLAGSTTVMSSIHAPFIQAERDVGLPTDERFEALVKFKDYASGGVEDWQSIFYVVLVVVFLINCFCLYYLFKHLFTDGQITDFCEPQNLFALAFMSPPSQSLSGSCGTGPTGPAFGKRFTVDMEQAATSSLHPHFYVRSADEKNPMAATEAEAGMAVRSRDRWEKVKGLRAWRVGRESPALEQYRRLAA